ncbi:hypothetical protein F5X96DRAFT_203026 [Biscogniauxia mediterranea]|nr:hypothetical protein F5X96DRAFT_203026 [Biscogniauxia mediterranea]
MLATMYHTPIFNLELSTPHRPAVSSPLSSSPVRPSQASSPLSPRHPNTVPRRDIQSSPIQGPSKFKYASRSAKPNPLKQTKENAQESRRKLFLKNVRQRADDKVWERRGGDQEALKLEWATFNRQWRKQKDSDIDGFVFEDELNDIPQPPRETPDDEMMVDTMAQDEEQEMEAMISMLEADSFSHQPTRPEPPSPSLSDDDDYDSIFRDLLSQQQQHSSSQNLVSFSQMDMS